MINARCIAKVFLCIAAVFPGQVPAFSQQTASGQRLNESAEGEVSPQLVIDLEGFVGSVAGLDFSKPDGRLVAAASGYEVRIWETATGKLLHTLRGDRGPSGYGACRSVAFSPSGSELLVGINPAGTGKAIRVYDTGDFTEIKELIGPNQPIHRLRFSLDGQYLSYGTQDGRISVLRWPSQQRVSEFSLSSDAAARAVQLKDFAFPLDRSDLLLAVTSDGPKIFDAQRGKEMGPNEVSDSNILEWMNRVFSQPSEGGYRLATDRTGDRQFPGNYVFRMNQDLWLAGETETAANGQAEYMVSVRGVRSSDARAVYSRHSRDVTAIALSPNRQVVASADASGEVHLWQVNSGERIHRLRPSGQPVYNATYLREGELGKLLFGNRPFGPDRWGRNSFGADHRYFSIQDRYLNALQDSDTASPSRAAADDHGRSDLTVRIERRAGQAGSVIRMLQNNQPVGQFNIASGRRVTAYRLPQQVFQQTRFPLIVGDDLGSLAMVDPQADRILRVFAGHTGMISSIQLLESQKLMVTGSTDRTVRVWGLHDLPPVGDIDIRLEDYRVIEVPVGSSAAGAGVRVGDEVLTIGGLRLEEIHRLKIRNEYPHRPGDRLKVELERRSDGRRFAYESTLVPGASWSEPMLTFFVDGEDWITWTPQGYYDASPGADRFIGWLMSQGPAKNSLYYPADRFRNSMYRPDIIREAWRTGNLEAAINTANQSTARHRSKVSLRKASDFEKVRPPEIAITAPHDRTRVDATNVQVRCSIRSFQSPVSKVTLLLNGQPVQTRRLTAEPNSEIEETFSIEMPSGQHRLGAIADSGRSQGHADEVSIASSQSTVSRDDRTNLFAIVIGVSEHERPEYNLRFAHRDAQVFAKALEEHTDGRVYDQVNIHLLDGDQGERATRTAIQDAMQEVQRQIRAGDTLVFFAACHGFFDKSAGQFYLGPYEVNERSLRSTALAWSEVISWLEVLPRSTRLFFLDACESGGAVSPSDPQWQLSSPQLGLVLFTSSSSNKPSKEKNELNHGIFSYALLSTIAGKVIEGRSPDMKGTGLLGVDELKYLVSTRVRTLSQNKQSPTIFKSRNLDIGHNVFEIRRSLERYLTTN